MIKLVVFDFDGVFTNGDICIDSNNNIIKKYNIKDGMGLKLLKDHTIKIGCISGFKENKSQLNILQHLSFDYISLGNNNKLEVIKKWCNELNINLDLNVAYMGDDINDIEIMKYVELSGCPQDSHNSCIEICNFISKKKGGDGCVREFCEFIIKCKEEQEPQFIINQIQKESIYQLKHINLCEINNLSKLILEKNKTNNIYFLAVGKSLNIAQHTCSILNSINIKCFLINSLNSIHGDIGCLRKDDIVICYSKSGNTSELIDIVPFIKSKECYIIGLCCHTESKFNNICDKTIVLPFKNEILNLNNINSIPTNSYMVFLYFTNILTYYLIINSKINIETYKLNHPAGNIGKNLKKIKDIIITKYPKIIFEDKIDINKVLLEMSKFNIGCCFFVNKEDILIGIMTDGDIRRFILKTNKQEISLNDINNKYYFETNINKYLKDCKEVGYIPVINNKKLIGIISNFFG
jgi:arabinose-5-phosphate isomerase